MFKWLPLPLPLSVSPFLTISLIPSLSPSLLKEHVEITLSLFLSLSPFLTISLIPSLSSRLLKEHGQITISLFLSVSPFLTISLIHSFSPTLTPSFSHIIFSSVPSFFLSTPFSCYVQSQESCTLTTWRTNSNTCIALFLKQSTSNSW